MTVKPFTPRGQGAVSVRKSAVKLEIAVSNRVTRVTSLQLYRSSRVRICNNVESGIRQVRSWLNNKTSGKRHLRELTLQFLFLALEKDFLYSSCKLDHQL